MKSQKRTFIFITAAILVGVLMMPGRAVIDIHIGLDDVAHFIGTAVIILGLFWLATNYKVTKDDDQD